MVITAGYLFDGWCYDESCGAWSRITPGSKIYEGRNTLYARFIPLKFDVGDGEGFVKVGDEEKTLNLNPTGKYIFLGWSEAPDDAEKIVPKAGETYQLSDFTGKKVPRYYAVWANGNRVVATHTFYLGLNEIKG